MATVHTLESINIMQGLMEQWQSGHFCDAKLKVDGGTLVAHKCVLSAASEYFRNMFLGNYKESKKREVEIKGVTHAAMQIILEAIYTKKLKLTNKTVAEVLSTADFLQMNEIVTKCEGHMIGKLTHVTCLQFLEVFDKFSSERGQKEAHNFIVRNFMTVANNKDFLKVSKEAICSYLTDENLQVDKEIDVFHVARVWIEHDENRLEFAAEIMGKISLALIPPDELTGQVRKVAFVHDNEKCMDLVFEALNYHGNVLSQPLYEGTVNRPRGKPSLFVIEDGGMTFNARDAALYVTQNDKTKLWHVPLEDHSQPPVNTELNTPFALHSVSLVTYGNFMFLFGVDNRSFSPVTMRYDGNSGTWINLAPIPREAAVDCAVVRIGEHIVVAGGMTIHKKSEYVNPDNPNYFTSDVHKYNIRTDSWSKCAKYPFKFASAGACEFNGLMYVAGGEIWTSMPPTDF